MYARQHKCALCRQPIPPTAILAPQEVCTPHESTVPQPSSSDHYQWLYEARGGGWWAYEERLSAEIEKAYNQNLERVHVQVSGYMYVVDFKEMKQYRHEKPERQRRIKRDIVSAPVKGVAGILSR